MKKAITLLASALLLATASCILVVEDGEPGSRELCVACGERYGSDGCCDDDAERCECGMIAGSPGCCE